MLLYRFSLHSNTVLQYLINAKFFHVFLVKPCTVPLRGSLQGGLEVPRRTPSQLQLGFRNIQFEVIGFVRVLTWV